MCKILFNGVDVSEAVLPEYEVGKLHEIYMEINNGRSRYF